jgi:hypothetical protein
MAGLGYKNFNTGDVLTAGDVDNYLMEQTVMVFASAAARTSALTSVLAEGMISYLKDTNSTEYYSGSAWVAIGAGSSGKVLQVVFASTSTSTTVASTTYTDSTLTATITPLFNTSKVLAIYSQSMQATRSAAACGGHVQLLRGSTSIQDLGQILDANFGGASCGLAGTFASSYLDSPATTSATTYKTQVKTNTTANSGQVVAQPSSTISSITLLEIGA